MNRYQRIMIMTLLRHLLQEGLSFIVPNSTKLSKWQEACHVIMSLFCISAAFHSSTKQTNDCLDIFIYFIISF